MQKNTSDFLMGPAAEDIKAIIHSHLGLSAVFGCNSSRPTHTEKYLRSHYILKSYFLF